MITATICGEYPLFLRLSGPGNLEINGIACETDTTYAFPRRAVLTVRLLPAPGCEVTGIQWNGEALPWDTQTQTLSVVMPDGDCSLGVSFALRPQVITGGVLLGTAGIVGSSVGIGLVAASTSAAAPPAALSGKTLLRRLTALLRRQSHTQ